MVYYCRPYIQNEVNTTLQPIDEQLAPSYTTVELKLSQTLSR